jgi:hypothetical protein
MSARRHEEILEECLSAYLEGRRSIEESLSLYPSYASDLEPLLRAAIRISDALAAESPPAHVHERGLQRFLSDSRARRNLAALHLGQEPNMFARLWHSYRTALVAAAIAVLVVAVSIGGTSLLGTDANDDPAPAAQELPPTPAAVRDFEAALHRVKTLGPRAKQADLLWLRVATEDLKDLPPEDVNPLLGTLSVQLAEAQEVVSDIADSNPSVAAEAAKAGVAIRTVADSLVSGTPDSTASSPSAQSGGDATPDATSPTPGPTDPGLATATTAPVPTDPAPTAPPLAP